MRNYARGILHNSKFSDTVAFILILNIVDINGTTLFEAWGHGLETFIMTNIWICTDIMYYLYQPAIKMSLLNYNYIVDVYQPRIHGGCKPLPTELDWRSESGRLTADITMTVITYSYTIRYGTGNLKTSNVSAAIMLLLGHAKSWM